MVPRTRLKALDTLLAELLLAPVAIPVRPHQRNTSRGPQRARPHRMGNRQINMEHLGNSRMECLDKPLASSHMELPVRRLANLELPDNPEFPLPMASRKDILQRASLVYRLPTEQRVSVLAPTEPSKHILHLEDKHHMGSPDSLASRETR